MKKTLIFSSLCLLSLTQCSKPPAQAPRLAPVAVVQPTQTDVALYKEYVGHVTPFVTVEVRSQIAGTIMAKYFTEGQLVKKDSPLLLIDDRPYIADLHKAEGALSRTIASLKFNEEKTHRYASLVQEEFVSQLDYDQYVTNVLEDKGTIKENLADIEIAKLNIGYCHINAPMDAIAGVLNVEVGNYVDKGGSNPLMVLNQVTPIYVDFYVPEKDLPQIQKLQRTGQLKTLAYLNEDLNSCFEGELTLINNQVDESTGTILLRATFPNAEMGLWPGEFANVRLILGVAKDAILLPTQSIQLGQQGHYVYVVKSDQTVELRPVELGQREEDNTIVLQGLQPQETVVLQGQINLYPGAKVAVVSITPGGK
ncbi:MAG: efflux RND transporter periplasmic adaptor subunit [Chlamydiales bacterium]|nr:efflux RND transporter periplasmic adaptor subunit [Chlamydiales bacterium]